MVWGFFHYAKLAQKGLISFTNGRIRVTGLRVLFVDIDTLRELEEKVREKFGQDEGARAVYEIAKGAGSRATKAHYKYSKKKGEELVHYMAKMASGAGWGSISVVNAGVNGEVVVKASPFKRRGAKKPTCDYLRGFLAGAAGYVYRRKMDCIEIECASNKHNACKFLLGGKRDLLKNKKLKPFAYQIKSSGLASPHPRQRLLALRASQTPKVCLVSQSTRVAVRTRTAQSSS